MVIDFAVYFYVHLGQRKENHHSWMHSTILLLPLLFRRMLQMRWWM